MAAYNKFNDFTLQLGKGVHQFHAAGHTFKVFLTNEAPLAADTVKADMLDLTTANGYTAGGADVQNDASGASGTLSVTGVDVVWTASGGTIGPFRYVVHYNDTATSPADALVNWWDYGSAVTLADGETFTVDFGASIFTLA